MTIDQAIARLQKIKATFGGSKPVAYAWQCDEHNAHHFEYDVQIEMICIPAPKEDVFICILGIEGFFKPREKKKDRHLHLVKKP